MSFFFLRKNSFSRTLSRAEACRQDVSCSTRVRTARRVCWKFRIFVCAHNRLPWSKHEQISALFVVKTARISVRFPTGNFVFFPLALGRYFYYYLFLIFFFTTRRLGTLFVCSELIARSNRLVYTGAPTQDKEKKRKNQIVLNGIIILETHKNDTPDVAPPEQHYIVLIGTMILNIILMFVPTAAITTMQTGVSKIFDISGEAKNNFLSLS